MKRILIVALALVTTTAVAQQNRGSRAGTMRPQAPRAETQRTNRPTAEMKGAPANTRMATLTPAMAARLQPLVPEGMTPAMAAEGFKNSGQFIAALHVSKNLGIPFADLKTQMTGTEAKSLGQAIQTLKPDLPEEKRAESVREATRLARQDEKEVRTQERASGPTN